MPKKKPIAKRLNKLFDEIKQEEPNAKTKASASQSTPNESTSSVIETRLAAKRARSRSTGAAKTITQTENILALAFQTSPTDWATLQVHGETAERKWSNDDQALVQQVTDQLTLALENARLFQQEQYRRQVADTLSELARIAGSSLNLNDVVQKLLEQLPRLVPFRTASIQLIEPSGRRQQIGGLARDEDRVETLNVPSDYLLRKVEDDLLVKDVVKSHSVVVINDTVNDTRWEVLPETQSVRSWLGAPLQVGSEVIGMLILDDSQTNAFSEDVVDLVRSFTSQAAIAIQNARLFQESQRRAQEMSALAELGREISATLELKSVLEKISEYAIILLNSVTSAVYLPDPEFKTLIPFAVMGEDAEEIKNDHLIVGTGILGNIAKSGAGEIVNNVYQDKRAITIKGTTENVPFEHLMAVPIKLQEQVTGLMAIWRVGEDTDFIDTEFDFFSNLSQQAAIAIENARLFQDVTNSQKQLSEALRIAHRIF